MKQLIFIAFTLAIYFSAPAQTMPGMNMPMQKSETKKTPPATTQKKPAEKVSYTCIMHPEIHADKPGNCPKCGMKLVKEKPKVAAKPASEKDASMSMSKDTSKAMKMDSKGDMKMDNMPMDGDTTGEKTMDMSGMNMNNMNMPKADLGTIKTIHNNMPPHTVHYDLYVRDTLVKYSGKTKKAIAVNGQIPMPTLTFTEGDTAEILVHNELDEETALHWHGVFVPNRYDGVPFLTQMPIKPHTSYLYKFPIIQHGTHLYHSHFGLQEQMGMYGSFIMNKRKEWDIPTIPVVLSDWADMKPEEIDRSLHNQTDWFGIRKNTIQSYTEAVKTGNLHTKLTNEWKRMTAMDVSDIAYDQFLINGENQVEYFSPLSPGEGQGVRLFKAGNKVRLRIANGGSSSYFWLTYSGGKITVVASDGNDVEPVVVDRLIIAPSETYDVVVTIPENKQYEFLATPEDRTKSASLWLGSGEKVPAAPLPKLKYFAGMKMMNGMMKMNGNMMQMEGMAMSNQTMDMNTVMYPEITGYEKNDKTKGSDGENGTSGNSMKGMDMNKNSKKKADDMSGMKMSDNSMAGMNMAPSLQERAGGEADIITLNYGMLRAPEKTTLPPGPLKEIKFDLTGNMNRYIWSMDNKTLSETDKILIKKGENVRIILYNNTMMRHPMHLHGHDFRLLNGQGDYAPLKNVIDIMPMERDTIEFAATESGDWFFHCHILYHMMSGMGRVISYEKSTANADSANIDSSAITDITDKKMATRSLNADDRMFHTMARIGLESNGTDGVAMLAQTRWQASTMWHLGLSNMHGYESETMIGRYLGKMQWWYPYAGFDYHYKGFNPGEKNIFGSDEKNLFGQISNKNNRRTVVAGIAYTLPMLVIADARVDGNGKFRFQLSRENIPISPRIRFNWMLNTDKEYTAGLRYILTKYISVSSHYDSDMGLGAGVTLTY